MKTPGTFEAKFYGQCHLCQEAIVPGESCKYDEDNAVVHARDCNPYSRRVEQRSANPIICPLCWLAIPCGCEP